MKAMADRKAAPLLKKLKANPTDAAGPNDDFPVFLPDGTRIR